MFIKLKTFPGTEKIRDSYPEESDLPYKTNNFLCETKVRSRIEASYKSFIHIPAQSSSFFSLFFNVFFRLFLTNNCFYLFRRQNVVKSYFVSLSVHAVIKHSILARKAVFELFCAPFCFPEEKAMNS